jgi:hypothetical protein
LGIGRREWNLEVISPYFDPRGAGPLKALIDAIDPRETRVFLPQESDGTAGAGEATYRAISEIPTCTWARLPSDVSERGRGSQGEKLQPRRVHAKVYRLWHFGERRDLLIVGSVNLTGAAHSHGGAGNLEAAFLVDVSDDGYPRRWWLETEEGAPERFLEQAPTEEDGLEASPIDLSLRYDWGAKRLAYRYGGQDRAGFEVCETSGARLFQVDNPRTSGWIDIVFDSATSERVEKAIGSSSFFLVKHPKGEWRVLVREESMGHRPSLLTELTPEEILEYWSLLTPEQRAAYIELRAGLGETDEGLAVVERRALDSRDTLFDRFAGVFHAFGCLRRHVGEAIEAGRDAEAETRLAGAKYDSLPMLLEKILKREGGDPVINYVTFLCALQLRRSLRKRHRDFFRGRRAALAGLDAQLARLTEVRKMVPMSGSDGRKYLDWFEEMFLKEL